MEKISYSRGAIKVIFADEDSKNEIFDCISYLAIIPYEEFSESSDLEIQMKGLKIFGHPMRLKVLQERTTLK